MRALTLFVLTVIFLPRPAEGQDIEGSHDHPALTRYPGSTIPWYEVDNYRPYRVATGPVTGYRQIDNWIDTEGRVTRIYYALDGSDRTYNEVYLNYKKAVEKAGFEILGAGLHDASARSGDVGSRRWQAVFFDANPFTKPGRVGEMTSGSATSGGRGSIVATKDRAAGRIYLAISVYQYSDQTVGTLVDIVEVESAETGLVAIDAEAIGAGIEEQGRVVLDGVLFDFDKATLQAASTAALEQIAAYLKANTDRSFFVVGHTDSKGTFAYNQALSTDRARAVVDALAREFGVERSRLEPYGVGPLAPVFSNASESGRDRNRRVELVER